MEVMSRGANKPHVIKADAQILRETKADAYTELQTKAKLLMVNCNLTLEVCDMVKLYRSTAEFSIQTESKGMDSFWL